MNYRNVIVLLCFPFLFKAQGGFRVRHFIPGAVTNKTKAIFETSPGNYITTGIIVDSVNGNYINRLTLTGLGQNGQMLWHKKYGTYNFMYLDNQLITRSYYKFGSNIYYAGGVMDSLGKSLGVLIKFDLNGDTIWQKLFKDNDGVVPQMVTKSVDGGFLITGYYVIGNPGLLIKTDANGNELWRKKITKTSPSVMDGKAITQDSATKKIVIVGYQYIGGANSFENLLILDSLGNKINQNNYNNTGGILFDLIQTKDKKYVAVGQKIYPQTLGGYNLIKSFAVKFDIDSPSIPIWKIDGYDELSLTNNFNCIYELENEDMLIGGDLDTTHTKQLTDNYFHRLIKIDKSGNEIWKRIYNYCSNVGNTYYQSLSSLSPGSNGSILASFQLYNTSPNPFFFVKYDSTGCDSSAAHCATLNLVGIDEGKIKNEKLRIFPNPVKDFLTIETWLADEVEVGIVDVLGRKVKRIIITQNAQVDVRDLEDGIYLVTISRNNEIITKTKIIKE